jgi:fatty acid desaturase
LCSLERSSVVKIAALVALILGVLLVVAGAAWVFPPAAPIVAGLALIVFAVRVDVGDA